MNDSAPVLKKRYPYATIALAAANIVYFLLLMAVGAVESTAKMVEWGALYMAKGTYVGSPFRIMTSMFMHFDIYHLGSNLLMLFVVGDMLEERLGRGRFVISYLISGLVGNSAAVWWYHLPGATVVSAGASGAVYGLVGVICCLVFRKRGSIPGFSRERVLLMIFLMLYSGFVNTGINVAAHVGGLAVGLLCGLLFGGSRKRRQNNRENTPFSGM